MTKIKVLMVDDEVQFRETTAKILTRRGFEVTPAASGQEALDILSGEPHDVVVLDIKMPGMDGHEALARIKKMSPKIQVIMLTGHGHIDSAVQALDQAAFDYLAKPCDIDRLAARIHDAYMVDHQGPREEKKAADIMIPLEEYTTINPSDSVREGIIRLQESFTGLLATDKLMQTGHRSLLVLDYSGDIVGALSIMDLIEALRPAYLSAPKPSMAYSVEYSAMFWSGLFTAQVKAAGRRTVADVMSPPPPTVDAEANLMETADLLYKEGSRRLVVLREGRPIGVIREQEIFFEAARIILESS